MGHERDRKETGAGQEWQEWDRSQHLSKGLIESESKHSATLRSNLAPFTTQLFQQRETETEHVLVAGQL